MAARVGKKRLTGPHKVAILFRLLGEDMSLGILRQMNDRDIARINRADIDLGEPDEETVESVAEDLNSRMDGSGVGFGGSRRIEGLIRQGFDEDRMEAILGRTDVELGKIQDTLAEIDARVVGRILSREYPQTCALIVSQLPSRQATEILLALPEDLRVDVIMRIARMEKISEDMLAELNRALEREISGFEGGSHAQEMEGVDVAVQIFMNMDRASEGSLLERVGEHDEEVAELIRERMFTFDDLLQIDDRGIQMVLRNVNTQTLVLALKGAEQAMLEKFLSNVSQRVSASLQEDLDTMGPVRLSEVEGAQQEIANIAREMSDRGEIQVPGRGDGDELV
ncbi:MAG: flagellar motor switch protein FliG [bacterium]|nr:flagellar motor switch protein FliG [bacterium]